MHKQIILVHVLLDQLLVLLSISTSNHQKVLTGDEPNEFLKPEDLPSDSFVLLLLELF
jgi:hypothetical protein